MSRNRIIVVDDEQLDRVVDVNNTRLRRKLCPYGRYITTRSGCGYGFSGCPTDFPAGGLDVWI